MFSRTKCIANYSEAACDNSSNSKCAKHMKLLWCLESLPLLSLRVVRALKHSIPFHSIPFHSIPWYFATCTVYIYACKFECTN